MKTELESNEVELEADSDLIKRLRAEKRELQEKNSTLEQEVKDLKQVLDQEGIERLKKWRKMVKIALLKASLASETTILHLVIFPDSVLTYQLVVWQYPRLFQNSCVFFQQRFSLSKVCWVFPCEVCVCLFG